MGNGNIDLGVEIQGTRSHVKNKPQNEPSGPYDTPEFNLNQFEVNDFFKVHLGFWGVSICILHIFNGLIMGYLSYVVFANYESTQWSNIYFLLPLGAIVQIPSYIGVLFRKDWARKTVVVLSYLQLILIPIGTITGLIMLSKLKGKTF